MPTQIHFHVVVLAIVFGLASANLVRLAPRTEYVYDYAAQSRLGDVALLVTSAKVHIRVLNITSDGQLCQLHIERFSQHANGKNDHSRHWDMSRWFSFLFSHHGEVTEVFHPTDEDLEVLNIKKALVGTLSARLHASDKVLKEGRIWLYQLNETGHEGSTPEPVYQEIQTNIDSYKETSSPKLPALNLTQIKDAILGNLTCVRNHNRKEESMQRQQCFFQLFALMDRLSEDDLGILVHQHVKVNYSDSVEEENCNIMVDALGSLGSAAAQRLLTKTVLQVRGASAQLIQRMLISFVTMKTPPVKEFVMALEELCFATKIEFEDPKDEWIVHSTAVLILGVVADRLKETDKERAKSLVGKLEDSVGIHDPWHHRHLRSTLTDDEINKHYHHKATLLESLGNAEFDSSFDHLLSYINNTDSPPLLRRSALSAIRKYDHHEAASLLLDSALFDEEEHVRYHAALQYQRHPKALNLLKIKQSMANGSISIDHYLDDLERNSHLRQRRGVKGIFDDFSFDELLELINIWFKDVPGVISDIIDTVKTFQRLFDTLSETTPQELFQSIIDSVQNLPDIIQGMARQASETWEKVAAYDNLPSFIEETRQVMLRVNAVFTEVKNDAKNLFSGIQDSAIVVIPWAVEQIWQGLETIFQEVPKLIKSPQTAIANIVKAVYNIYKAVMALIDVKDLTNDVFSFTEGMQPFLLKVGDEIQELFDDFMRVWNLFQKEAPEWIEGFGEHTDGVLEDAFGNMKSSRNEVVRVVNEALGVLQEPLEKIGKLVGPFLDAYESTVGTIKSIQKCFESLKKGYETARGLIQKIFGPKASMKFPKQKLDPETCGGGLYPSRAVGQTRYASQGIDLILAKDEETFLGGCKLPNSMTDEQLRWELKRSGKPTNGPRDALLRRYTTSDNGCPDIFEHLNKLDFMHCRMQDNCLGLSCCLSLPVPPFNIFTLKASVSFDPCTMKLTMELGQMKEEKILASQGFVSLMDMTLGDLEKELFFFRPDSCGVETHGLDLSGLSELSKQFSDIIKDLRDAMKLEWIDTIQSDMQDLGIELGMKDSYLTGTFPMGPWETRFFDVKVQFMVGPIPMYLGFGAGGFIGVKLEAGVSLMKMTAYGQVTPQVGATVYASLGISLLILSAELQLKGYVLTTDFPTRAEIQFSKFPLNIGARMDMVMIPLRLELRSMLKSNLFGWEVTLLDFLLWDWETPPVIKNIFNTGIPEPDFTPPTFRKFKVKTSRTTNVGKRAAITTHCDVEQVAGRDFVEPAFQLEVAAEDDVSQVKLTYDVGTYKGGSDVVSNEGLGGPSNVVFKKMKGGVPLYFTVTGTNSGGGNAKVTCELPTYDVTLPGGRVTPDFLTTSHPSILRASAVAHDDSVIRLKRVGHFHNFERLGVGHAVEFRHEDLQLSHDSLYYFNFYLNNALGYVNILTSPGVLADFTPPSPGPLENVIMDVLMTEDCGDFVLDHWEQFKCGEQTPLPNHRWIVDGEGSRTVFNGHEPLVDMWYTRANRYVSANWDGFHDNETGLHGYSWTSGRAPCGQEVHPHIDPHAHLFSVSEWTHDGIASPLNLEDGEYHITVRAINNVEFGGAMATTVCHTTPYVIDNTPPFVHHVHSVEYDETDFSITAEYNVSDPLSNIREIDFGLGRSKRDVHMMDWYRHGNTTHTSVNFHIPDGVPAWVKVRAINNVDLREVGHADQPVLVDTSPPIAGTLYDGGVHGHDLNFTSDPNTICANWKDFHDEESGLSHYFWGVGSEPGTDDVVPLTEYSHTESQACADVQLSHNTTYYSVLVAVNNGHDNLNVSKSSDGVLFDATPPVEGTLRDGLEPDSDLAFSSEPSTVSANWDGYSDPESGIGDYAVTVQRTHSLGDGEYHITVRAINNVEFGGAMATTVCHTTPYVIDNTPPFVHHVHSVEYDETDFSITAEYNVSDPLSNIREIDFGLGRSKRDVHMMDWYRHGNTTHTSVNFHIPDGVPAWVKVRAINNVDLREVGHADQPVLVDTSPPIAGTLYDGSVHGHDLNFTSDPNTICANWKDFHDEESGLILFDATPPVEGTLRDGLEPDSDLAFSSEPSTVSANWAGYSDPESGIGDYAVTVQRTHTLGENRTHSSEIIHEKTSVGPDASHINWHKFHLHHGDHVSVQLETTNQAMSSTVTSSDGFIMDLTKPVMVHLGDGAEPGKDRAFSADASRISANWIFEDAESGIEKYKITIFRKSAGTKRQIYPEREQKAEVDGTQNTWTSPANLSLKDGAFYFVRVTAVNGAGASTVHETDGLIVDTSPPNLETTNQAMSSTVTSSDGFIMDLTKPVMVHLGDGAEPGKDRAFSMDNVRIGVTSGEPEELYDGYVLHTDLQGIQASWMATDAQSGVVSYWVAVGTTPGGNDVSDYQNLGPGSDGYVGNLNLQLTNKTTNSPIYYLTVKAENAAGSFSRNITSSPIKVVRADQAGTVTDGWEAWSTVEQAMAVDVDYQRDVSTVTVQFSGFESEQHGITHYEWSVGTEPRLDDVQPYTAAGIVLSDHTDNPGGGLSSHGQAQSLLPLSPGVQYYATVRAITGAGNVLDFSTDGFTVDISPPVIQIDSVGVQIGNNSFELDWERSHYQKSVDSISANWHIMESKDAVAYSWFCYGSYPGACDVYSVTNTTDTSVPNSLVKPIRDGASNTLTVSAMNVVGLWGRAISGSLTVDETPPVAGEVFCPQFIQDSSELSCHWHGFYDTESTIQYYMFGVGEAEGDDSIFNFTRIPSHETHYSPRECAALDVKCQKSLTQVAVAWEPFPDPESPISRDYQDHNEELSAHWDFSGDPCPISKYEWSILKVDGTVMQPFTEVPPGQTSGNNDELQMHDGETFFVAVRATNEMNFTYTVRSDGITVMLEPLIPGEQICEVTETEECTSLMNKFDVHPLTNVGKDTAVEVGDLELVHNKTYTVVVLVTDQSAECSLASSFVTVDITPPKDGSVWVGPFKGESVSYSSRTDELHVSWADFSDPESGIGHYEIAVFSGTACTEDSDERFQVTDFVPVLFNDTKYTVTDIKLESVSYSSRTDELHVSWADFSDPESGIGHYEIAVFSGTACTEDSDERFQETEFVPVIFNDTKYTMTDITLEHHDCLYIFFTKPGIPCFVRLRTFNKAGLSIITESPPVLLDLEDPIGGTVKDGRDFSSDVTHQSSTTTMEGTFIYLPTHDGDKCPSRQYLMESEEAGWSSVSSDSVYGLLSDHRILFTPDEVTFGEDGLYITMSRDVQQTRMYSGAYSTRADMQGGGSYRFDMIAASGDIKAVTSVVFWDGPAGVVGDLEAPVEQWAREEAGPEDCTCCLRNNTGRSANNTGLTNSTTDVVTRDLEGNYALLWCRFENDTVEPVEEMITLDFDPTVGWHTYELKITIERTFAVGEDWNLELIIDGRSQAIMSGIPVFSDQARLTLAVWNRDDFVPDVQDVFSSPEATAFFRHLRLPPSADNLCRYGDPFRPGDNSVSVFYAGVGTEKLKDDVAPFREVARPCVPCLKPCDKFDCDPDCSSMDTSAFHVRIDNLTLSPNVSFKQLDDINVTDGAAVYYITVKAVSGSGRVVMSSSNGVNIDVTPPDIQKIYHVDMSWDDEEISDFQGSNSTIAVRYRAFDRESQEDWSLELIIDGRSQAIMSGIPVFSDKARLTLAVWNRDDFVPEVQDVFSSPEATAFFRHLRLPPSADNLCRYGDPFRPGDNSVSVFYAGVGTEKLKDDVAPFREVARPCVPCVKPCDKFDCDPDCLNMDTSAFHVRIDNLTLSPNVSFKQLDGLNVTDGAAVYYITVKAVSGSGRVVMSSSNGVNIDVTPPDIQKIYHVDMSWDDEEISDFQGSNSTIAVRYRAFDRESQVVEYFWAIGTSPGGTDVQPFRSNGLKVLAVNSDLEGHLLHGSTYYVTLRAVNGAGLQSTVMTSGVTVLFGNPDVAHTNTTVPFGEEVPLPEDVHIDDTVMITDLSYAGLSWGTPREEEGITATFFSLSSDANGMNDVLPLTRVGGGGSGSVIIVNGTIQTHGKVSNVSDLQRDSPEEEADSSDFHMEPGRIKHWLGVNFFVTTLGNVEVPGPINITLPINTTLIELGLEPRLLYWNSEKSSFNSRPVIVSHSRVEAQEDEEKDIWIRYFDLDGDRLSFSISVPPLFGNARLEENEEYAVVYYTPCLDCYGTDKINISAVEMLPDNPHSINIQLVVEVEPRNDDPVLFVLVEDNPALIVPTKRLDLTVEANRMSNLHYRDLQVIVGAYDVEPADLLVLDFSVESNGTMSTSQQERRADFVSLNICSTNSTWFTVIQERGTNGTSGPLQLDPCDIQAPHALQDMAWVFTTLTCRPHENFTADHYLQQVNGYVCECGNPSWPCAGKLTAWQICLIVLAAVFLLLLTIVVWRKWKISKKPINGVRDDDVKGPKLPELYRATGRERDGAAPGKVRRAWGDDNTSASKAAALFNWTWSPTRSAETRNRPKDLQDGAVTEMMPLPGMPLKTTDL
uniref:Fibronectin type-III domain-containing protein n=1 Tax=Branchiostoma floridae TaxID=7739 RepID=C3ZSF9_BRAFL|eukprot:XP_002588513.1 hypothetical protein BRAFLDRAFT_79466 [Branchiostoma floridae]